MEQKEKGNIINYENILVHLVQRKKTQIYALWAYNNMNLEKIPSHSTFFQTPLRTAFYSARNVLK